MGFFCRIAGCPDKSVISILRKLKETLFIWATCNAFPVGASLNIWDFFC
jgi:hypothetical protein